MSLAHRLAIRTKHSDVTYQIKNAITDLDHTAVLEHPRAVTVGNPVTFWITTVIDPSQIERMDGVESVVLSQDQTEIYQGVDFNPYNFIIESTYRYPADSIEKRWGEFASRREYDRLRFTSRGLARITQIFGWITALGTLDPEIDSPNRTLARMLARSICNKLDYLASYGGMKTFVFEDRSTVEIPKFLIELDDFGEFNSLEFFAYSRSVIGVPAGVSKTLQYNTIPGPIHYVFDRSKGSFNGGLNYHGPARGQSSVVVLSSMGDLWSINT